MYLNNSAESSGFNGYRTIEPFQCGGIVAQCHAWRLISPSKILSVPSAASSDSRFPACNKATLAFDHLGN